MSGLLDTRGVARTSHPDAGNAVRSARRGAERTQAELADEVGVSRQTIVAIENGGYAPSVYLALALGRALGRSVEDLFAPATDSGRARTDTGDTP